VFWSSYMPCARCGKAIERSSAGEHRCDPQRRVEFQMVAMRHRLLTFEADLQRYLDSNEGRFEQWVAAREVRRSRRSA
jgi:hypothetical protein